MKNPIYDISVSGAWNASRVYAYMFKKKPETLAEVIKVIKEDPEVSGDEARHNLEVFEKFSSNNIDELAEATRIRREKHVKEEISTYAYPGEVEVFITEIPLL